MARYCCHLVTVQGIVGLLLFSAINKSLSVDTIPIGVLVGLNDHDIKAAFRLSLTMNQNHQKQNKIRITDETVMLPMDNSFAVGTAICQVMSKGIYAFYAAHTPSTLNTIKSYSATFKMPFVTSGMAVNSTRQEVGHGYEIYVRPLYVRALADAISHHSWKEVWYIYNSNEGLERLQQLFDVLTEDNQIVRTHVYRVADGTDAYNTLKHIDSQRPDYKHIILDLPTKECEALFQLAIKPPRSLQHHFLLAGLGISEFGDGALAGMNITGFRFPETSVNQQASKFIKAWQALDSTKYPGAGQQTLSYEAALAADAATVIYNALMNVVRTNPNIFKSTTSRDSGMYGSSNNNNVTDGIDCDADSPQQFRYGADIMKALRDNEVTSGVTGSIKFDKFGLRRDYKLEMWESSRNHKLDKVGNWNPSPSTDPKRLTVSAPVRPKWNNTIANRTRFVTSILDPPFLVVKPQVEGPNGPLRDNDLYEGYCADLAAEVARIIGIDYRIRPVKDGAYGKKNDDGSWNGMIGELMREEADLAIAPLTITSSREQVVDFSKPFMSLGISIMIKKPTKEAPGVFSFMNPLSYEVWMCVIFAYIGVSVVLFLVSRFSPFEWHIEDSSDGVAVANNFTIFNSLWFSLGAFMQQGVDIEPRSMSGRIVGSVWWFFTLILISSYTANLAAFLTAERMQSPIESAEDLAKQTEIKYGTVDSGSTKEFFRQSTIPTYERMWSFMSSTEPTVFVASTLEGVNRVREKNGKYAFLMESTVNDYTNNRLPCDTMKVGSNLDSKGYGIGTPPGSDLRDRVTLAVLELIEAGVLETLRKKWWYLKGECSGKDGLPKKQEATSALDLTNVLGIFYILIGGLCMSLLIAGIEFLHKSRMEARRRKTSFTNAARKEARLSITGQREVDDTPSETAHGSEIPPNMSMSTYSYAPAAQLVGLDGFGDANLQTQV